MFFQYRRNSCHVLVACCAVFALSASICLPTALAQKAPSAKGPNGGRNEEALKGASRAHTVGQVAVSPDGKRLAWIQAAKDGPEIRVAPYDDLSKSERVTAAAKSDQHCHEGEIAWAPDSKSLAFFMSKARPARLERWRP